MCSTPWVIYSSTLFVGYCLLTLIERSTQMLVDILNKDPATTVVVIDEVNTDNWGVGGKVVTQLRAGKNKQQSDG